MFLSSWRHLLILRTYLSLLRSSRRCSSGWIMSSWSSSHFFSRLTDEYCEALHITKVMVYCNHLDLRICFLLSPKSVYFVIQVSSFVNASGFVEKSSLDPSIPLKRLTDHQKSPWIIIFEKDPVHPKGIQNSCAPSRIFWSITIKLWKFSWFQICLLIHWWILFNHDSFFLWILSFLFFKLLLELTLQFSKFLKRNWIQRLPYPFFLIRRHYFNSFNSFFVFLDLLSESWCRFWRLLWPDLSKIFCYIQPLYEFWRSSGGPKKKLNFIWGFLWWVRKS